MKSKILFDTPLEKCTVYKDLSIDSSWRSQFDSQMATPMFALSKPSLKVLATQSSLEFSPTQYSSTTENSGGPKKAVFQSSLVATQALSTFESDQFKIQSTDRSFGSTSPNNNSQNIAAKQEDRIKVGKRFTKRIGQPSQMLEETKVRFAKQHFNRFRVTRYSGYFWDQMAILCDIFLSFFIL